MGLIISHYDILPLIMTYFDDKFEITDPPQPLLPFYHFTSVIHLKEILESRIMKTSRAHWWNEELLFLSYGRPNFRPLRNNYSNWQSSHPVFFLFNSNSISDIKRILPFDVYGLDRNPGDNYDPFGALPGNLVMNPRKESIAKLVNYFYGSNENFVRQIPKENVPNLPFSKEVEWYHNLIKDTTRINRPDLINIEIQLNKSIPINNVTVKAVMLPVMLHEEKSVLNFFLKECQAEVIFYDTNMPVNDYLNNLLGLVKPDYKSFVKLDEVNAELIRYLAKHPNKMYEINPRKFEELVAELLRDRGYDIFLTPPTVDGGRDIIAAFDSPLKGKIISIVECKRYNQGNTIGIDIIKQFLYTLREQDKANIGLIVTTSSFSEPAKRLQNSNKWLLNLHDFDELKEWLTNYGKWEKSNQNGGIWMPRNPIE